MKRLALVMLLLSACSWSNSLYHARRLSNSALKAEREDRTFDAGTFWGQVAVKADSAYQRDPGGTSSNEALWLRGRALARMGDCTAAMPLLERAQASAAMHEWHDDLGLELARCRLAAGDVDLALELVRPLITSTDDRLRLQARSLAGRSLMQAERWQEASEFLAGDASLEGSWLHAVALARLGREADALAAVEDRIVVGDSLANWVDLFRAFATRAGSAGGDALRARLAEHGWVTDTVKHRWDLATAQAMMSHDSAVATLLLERIIEGPRTPSTMQARMLIADRLLAQAHDDTTLFAALERIAEFGRADPSMLFVVQGFTRWGEAMRADLDSTPAGAPEGDMMLLYHATIARDSLRAPALASWLLGRLERDWPASPYIGKALLARMVLEPDSLEALRARLESHTDSPYLAYVTGTEGSRFAELEWSLDFYLGERFASAASTTQADQ